MINVLEGKNGDDPDILVSGGRRWVCLRGGKELVEETDERCRWRGWVRGVDGRVVGRHLPRVRHGSGSSNRGRGRNKEVMAHQ